MAKTETLLRELITVLRPDTRAVEIVTRDECASTPLPDDIDTGKLKGSKRTSYIEGFKAAWALFAAKIREKS